MHDFAFFNVGNMRDMVSNVWAKGQIGIVVQAEYVLEIDVLTNCGLPRVKVNSA
jgi:hypothetical protein